jgi:hypothetical protein
VTLRGFAFGRRGHTLGRMEITLRTVGDFIDHEHEIMVACTAANCGESKNVDLAELAERLGRDRDLYGDAPSLARCLRCVSPSKLYVLDYRGPVK